MPKGVYVRAPSPIRTTGDIIEQFWSNVAKSDGCWEWTGLLDSGGYGRFAPGRGVDKKAHRVAWWIAFGPIKKGVSICHHCDNRKCVREDHLFAGTQRDNLRDASRKRRLPNQLKTHCSKGHELSGDNVRERYGRGERRAGASILVYPLSFCCLQVLPLDLLNGHSGSIVISARG